MIIIMIIIIVIIITICININININIIIIILLVLIILLLIIIRRIIIGMPKSLAPCATYPNSEAVKPNHLKNPSLKP